MNKRIVGLFVFIISISVTSNARDSNKQLDNMILRPLNFIEEVSKSVPVINKNLKNKDGCVDFISDKLDKIDRLNSESFFPQSDEEIEELEKKGMQTLDQLFQIQLMVRQKQRELEKSGQLTFECLQNIRRSSRYLRVMEDMLIEWLAERKKITNFSSGVLQGEFPQLMINSNVNKSTHMAGEPNENLSAGTVNFNVGDLFLIRGKSYVSGMIARIGDIELQFSHLAILGLNDKNEKVIIEALIPYGTRITLFEDWLNQKEARVVLFRFEDPIVAAKAGKSAFELANGFLTKMGHAIPYDFNMNPLDTDSIFCAELIENAYLTGSDSKVQLPQHKTMTTKFKSTPFLKSMGIEANEIFAPGDIEFDTRFDLVAEYRFVGKYDSEDRIPLLRKIRLQDAITQSLYNWMVGDNYQFVDSLKINIKTILAKLFRYVGFFKDKFPTHMPLSSLKTVMQFEDTSHILEERLLPLEIAFYNEKKHAMHFQEMLKILKDFRDDECRKPATSFNTLMTAISCNKD